MIPSANISLYLLSFQDSSSELIPNKNNYLHEHKFLNTERLKKQFKIVI